MKQLTVQLPQKSYDIIIGNAALAQLGQAVKKISHAQKIMIITDDNVAPLYLQTLMSALEAVAPHVSQMVLAAGEESKSMACLEAVYNKLCQEGLTRSDLIVALGGGVIGDLAGFAAATYLRGIDYVQVPTSLLAQVDSAVGGKVAIDLMHGKNLAGAFYQPKLVIADTQTLQTLPERIFRDGMGEVIKYGCIYHKALFELIEENPSREQLMTHMEDIVTTCLELKRHVVETDERDTGNRMVLNFGHTLGHALEKAQGYQGLRHGEAVCVGMAQITRLSEQKGLTQKGTAKRLEALLAKVGLPSFAHSDMPLEAIIAMDKKNINTQLTVVLLKCIGESYLYRTDISFLQEAMKWLH